jgi:hypothetical protein
LFIGPLKVFLGYPARRLSRLNTCLRKSQFLDGVLSQDLNERATAPFAADAQYA